jgi:DNA-binding MarR family transcriptional regulator
METMQLELKLPKPKRHVAHAPFLDRPVVVPARKLARRTNPATSQDAAGRVAEFASDHHAIILATLRKHGGSTVNEVATYCKLDAHAVGKRMNELERAGLARCVMDAGKGGHCGQPLTRMTPSGRQARVWEAA